MALRWICIFHIPTGTTPISGLTYGILLKFHPRRIFWLRSILSRLVELTAILPSRFRILHLLKSSG